MSFDRNRALYCDALRIRGSQIALSALVMALATPALAHQPADAQPPIAGAAPAPVVTDTADDTLPAAVADEVIVTGTRISGFSTPTPVTSLGSQEIASKAITNVSQLFSEIPAFAANQNVGQTSGAVGSANINLRSLGTARTLLLVDGRRVIATVGSGSIDINLLPTSIIKQVDIVTGGASAAYGSDAVSGVVNITLDHKFEGAKLDAQYATSTYGDVDGPAISGAAGTSLLDDRLHLVASVDYYKTNGQLFQSSRPWGRDNYALVSNPNYVAGNGTTRFVIAPNALFSQLTFGGVTAINSIAALRGLQFGPGGTVLPFTYGSLAGSTFMIGGSGVSISGEQNIFPKIDRVSAFGRATYDLSDDFSVFADILYAKSNIFTNSSYSNNPGNLTIQRDNAFLPQAIRDILTANNRTSLQIGRLAGEEGAYEINVDNDIQRYGFGVEGSLGDSWKVSLTGQISRAGYLRTDGNNRNLARFANAVDSILVNGVPVCRIKVQNPTSTNTDISQCVPANVFGAGSISPEAVQYIKGSAFGDTAIGESRSDTHQKQDIAAFNIDGKPFDTWAGPVAIAAGAEYRREAVVTTVDGLSAIRGWQLSNPQPLSGVVKIREVYAELAVPLLADSALGDSLELNGAGRVTDYSTSGTEYTYKVGMNYVPFQGVRLRGTYSRDIRAANLNELFSGTRQTRSVLTNPLTNQSVIINALTGGNPNLTPERADTYTIGASISPVQIPRFRASLDYYSISIDNAITTIAAQDIINGCLLGTDPSLCGSVTLTGGVLTDVSATLLNVGSVKTAGIDFEAVYALPVLAGNVDFRLLATHIDKLTTTLNGVTIDQAGDVGGAGTGNVGPPKWRGNFTMRYTDPRFTLGTSLRYVGGGKYSNGFVEGVDINDNSVPSRVYLDLDASIAINETFQVYARVNNVLNKEPPLIPNNITQPSYNQSPFYDIIGRFFKFGVRAKI